MDQLLPSSRIFAAKCRAKCQLLLHFSTIPASAEKSIGGEIASQKLGIGCGRNHGSVVR